MVNGKMVRLQVCSLLTNHCLIRCCDMVSCDNCDIVMRIESDVFKVNTEHVLCDAGNM